MTFVRVTYKVISSHHHLQHEWQYHYSLLTSFTVDNVGGR
jgi:hypothetical protein